ncbi:MAG: tyrosine-type recombinase/integrase [Bacillota bacterium]|nr:tyrosine-type recombinase/integrase [Bacillota bacterium]
MDFFIEKYKQYLENKRTSSNTVFAYSKDLDEFCSFLKKSNINIKDVKDSDFSDYADYISGKGYIKSTVARKLISVRNFFKFLYKNDYLSFNPTLKQDIPKTERKIPVILDIEEIDRLLTSIEPDTLKGIRDRALLELMYACGLKANETVNLKLNNLNLKMGYIICIDSKGKERIIPFGDMAETALTKYLDVRGDIEKVKNDYLFLNLLGSKLSRQALWKILKERAKNADITKEIDLNTIRHSFAVHLLSNGADIKSIQELMGHKELTTTLIYANIKKRNKLKEIYNKAHPRA